MARKPKAEDPRAEQLLATVLVNAMSQDEAVRTLGWDAAEVAEVASALESAGKIEYRRPGIMSLAK